MKFGDVLHIILPHERTHHLPFWVLTVKVGNKDFEGYLLRQRTVVKNSPNPRRGGGREQEKSPEFFLLFCMFCGAYFLGPTPVKKGLLVFFFGELWNFHTRIVCSLLIVLRCAVLHCVCLVCCVCKCMVCGALCSLGYACFVPCHVWLLWGIFRRTGKGEKPPRPPPGPGYRLGNEGATLVAESRLLPRDGLGIPSPGHGTPPPPVAHLAWCLGITQPPSGPTTVAECKDLTGRHGGRQTAHARLVSQ